MRRFLVLLMVVSLLAPPPASASAMGCWRRFERGLSGKLSTGANALVWIGTFLITGVSVWGAANALTFVKANFGDLRRDLARGRGEVSETLAGVLGCPASAIPDFQQAAQSRYEQLFPTAETTPEELTANLSAMVFSEPALATCRAG